MSVEEISRRALTIEGVLAAQTCQEWIQWAESEGFEAADFQGKRVKGRVAAVRNNDRVIEDNPQRALGLWEGILPHLPQHVRAFDPMRRGALGRHEAFGLNPRFRWYRYHPGQRFKPHVDRMFQAPDGAVSLWTVLVYLNGVEQGGQTRVSLDEKGKKSALVEPSAGLVLCFDHDVLHEGVEVNKGVKYVLRTDIMYRRV